MAHINKYCVLKIVIARCKDAELLQFLHENETQDDFLLVCCKRNRKLPVRTADVKRPFFQMILIKTVMINRLTTEKSKQIIDD